ncbi:MAG: glycerol-3-phosphate 1-O-acyltransferase [Acidimicrobiia bacterium]
MGDGVYEAMGLVDEPGWPVGAGPYLFLVEESGPLERKLLHGWISRNCPASVARGDVQEATLPQTRRKRRRRRPDPRLEAFLAEGDDPLLVPLRVLWLPSTESDGERRVGLKDLLVFGDPRDPDPIRQRVIHRTRPDRVRIIMGEPARRSEVRDRWEAPDEKGRARGLGFADYTAHQAWLALERAERKLRGNKYKVPKFVRETLVARRSFAQGVARLARESGATYEQMAARTRRYTKEIAATHSPYVIDLVTGGFSWLISKAYLDLRYSRDDLARLYELGTHHPLVFLPSHKSNFDHLVLQYVLHRNGLPPNHTAGGINMNFFPVGPVLRRSGLFFIRRSFGDNEPYKFVLRQYVDYLLEKRFPLEWYIEGGRSRSGKLREPRLGMLAYVFDSYRRGSTDDVVLIPVSIAYDQIQDVGSYAEEQKGGTKTSESFSWMVRSIRGLRLRYGAAHVRFGTPISLAGFLTERGHTAEEDDGRSAAVPKLAFEVAVAINDATPITPISLVTLALLTAGDLSLTAGQTMEVLEPFADFVRRRSLPVTEKLALDDPDRVHGALGALVAHGIVSRFEGATSTVYRVGPEQHLSAAFYRNTIIHHFVNAAITELALLHARDADGDRTRATLAEALRIRNVLKFEFFFRPSDEFSDQIISELDDHDPDWRSHLESGDVDAVLDHFRPFLSPAVLRPFLEAYQVVADLIADDADEARIDTDGLVEQALDLGKQYLLQRRIRSAESVSTVLFGSAVSLADNRKLFDDGPDIPEARRAHAAQLHDLTRRLNGIEALAAARAAGLQ